MDYGKFGYQGYMPPPVAHTCKWSNEPELNLSTLPEDVKRQVWRIIKEDAPELIDLIRLAAETANHFDGEVLIEHKHLPRRVLEIAGEHL